MFLRLEPFKIILFNFFNLHSIFNFKIITKKKNILYFVINLIAIKTFIFTVIIILMQYILLYIVFIYNMHLKDVYLLSL